MLTIKMPNKFLWCFIALFCTTVVSSAIGDREVDYRKTDIKKSYDRDFETRDYDNRDSSKENSRYDTKEYELSENQWDDEKYMKEKHKKDKKNHHKFEKRNHKDRRDFIDDEWDKHQLQSKDEEYFRKNKGEKAKHWKSDDHESDKRHFKHKKYDFNMKDDEIIPPDHTKYIAMARYVVHETDWCSIATTSTLPALKGFPFSNVASFSDGPVDNSTGVPYFYLTPLDFSSKDLSKDSRCTITVTLAQTDFCNSHNMDPEDPRCARVILSGKMKKVRNDTAEYEFAKNALFIRHPSMAELPKDHEFYVAKIKISQIALLDWFGGAKYIPISDYLAFKGIHAEDNINNNEKKSQISDITDNGLSPSVIQQ